MRMRNLVPLLLFFLLLGLTPALVWGSQAEPDKAQDLNKQLIRLYQAGHYQEALPLAQQVLKITEKALGPEHPETAAGLNNLAELYRAMGAYDQALPLYQRALKIREKALGPKHPDTAQSLNNLAELYRAMGDYDQALPLYQRALKIREKALGPKDPDTAQSLNNLAELYRAMGDYKQALPLYQRALNIHERVLGPEHPYTATSLNGLALLYQAKGAYDQALPRYQRVLKIYEKALGPEHPATATCLHNLAGLYQAMGAYDQALPLLQRALKIREKALGPEHPDVAQSLNNLAEFYRATGAYDQALPLYQRALNIHEKALGPEHPSTAASLNNLAALYEAMGAYDEALPLYQRGLKIWEKALGPEPPSIAAGLNNLAGLYRKMGAYDQALPLYQRARNIHEKALGLEHPSTATSLDNLAGLYEAMGAYDEALPLYQGALNIREKALSSEHPDTATSLNNLAGLYEAMGAYDQALPLYQGALNIREKALGPEHPDTATSLNNLAIFYLSRKDWTQAENYFRRGNSQAGSVELALARGRFDEALGLLHGLDPSWQSTHQYQVQFYTQKGLALAGVGRLPEASVSLWQAVKRTETLRQKVTGERTGFLQAGIYGGYIRPYRGLLTVLAQMDRKGIDLPTELKPYGPEPRAAAFYFAEATKARAMLDSLAQAGRKTSRAEIPEALRQREQNVLNQLAATEAQWEKALQGGEEAVREAKDKREKLNAELQALIKELRNTYPLYAALHYPQPLPAKDLPLQENEVLLEYALGEEASYVFVVRKGGVIHLHPIPLGKEALGGKVEDFMVPFLNPGQADFSDKRARELYDLLLAQPLAQIKKGEQLIIVPDGMLGLLPFEALVLQEGRGDQKRVFVGDQHTPVYYQSATVLALQRRLQEAKPPRPLFALGNPIYNAQDERYLAYKQGKLAPLLTDRDKKQDSLQVLASDVRWGKTMSGDKTGKTLDFESLPETEPMVKNIATAWGIPPTPPDVLLGLQANETHMRQAPLQEYQYLLFATHADTSGKVQTKNEPFILLGQVENEPKDDGFLTLGEVLDLKIQAQMVALCACHTGRGKVMEGEGVVNFARAFQHAGARSVLVGLWEARSKVAAAYMQKFFGCLKDGKSRTEALRQARQEVKHRWGDDPYLWAVFILHGEE